MVQRMRNIWAFAMDISNYNGTPVFLCGSVILIIG